jgi:hypothetical protein
VRGWDTARVVVRFRVCVAKGRVWMRVGMKCADEYGVVIQYIETEKINCKPMPMPMPMLCSTYNR